MANDEEPLKNILQQNENSEDFCINNDFGNLACENPCTESHETVISVAIGRCEKNNIPQKLDDNESSVEATESENVCAECEVKYKIDDDDTNTACLISHDESISLSHVENVEYISEYIVSERKEEEKFNLECSEEIDPLSINQYEDKLGSHSSKKLSCFDLQSKMENVVSDNDQNINYIAEKEIKNKSLGDETAVTYALPEQTENTEFFPKNGTVDSNLDENVDLRKTEMENKVSEEYGNSNSSIEDRTDNLKSDQDEDEIESENLISLDSNVSVVPFDAKNNVEFIKPESTVVVSSVIDSEMENVVSDNDKNINYIAEKEIKNKSLGDETAVTYALPEQTENTEFFPKNETVDSNLDENVDLRKTEMKNTVSEEYGNSNSSIEDRTDNLKSDQDEDEIEPENLIFLDSNVSVVPFDAKNNVEFIKPESTVVVSSVIDSSNFISSENEIKISNKEEILEHNAVKSVDVGTKLENAEGPYSEETITIQERPDNENKVEFTNSERDESGNLSKGKENLILSSDSNQIAENNVNKIECEAISFQKLKKFVVDPSKDHKNLLKKEKTKDLSESESESGPVEIEKAAKKIDSLEIYNEESIYSPLKSPSPLIFEVDSSSPLLNEISEDYDREQQKTKSNNAINSSHQRSVQETSIEKEKNIIEKITKEDDTSIMDKFTLVPGTEIQGELFSRVIFIGDVYINKVAINWPFTSQFKPFFLWKTNLCLDDIIIALRESDYVKVFADALIIIYLSPFQFIQFSSFTCEKTETVFKVPTSVQASNVEKLIKNFVSYFCNFRLISKKTVVISDYPSVNLIPSIDSSHSCCKKRMYETNLPSLNEKLNKIIYRLNTTIFRKGYSCISNSFHKCGKDIDDFSKHKHFRMPHIELKNEFDQLFIPNSSTNEYCRSLHNRLLHCICRNVKPGPFEKSTTGKSLSDGTIFIIGNKWLSTVSEAWPHSKRGPYIIAKEKLSFKEIEDFVLNEINPEEKALVIVILSADEFISLGLMQYLFSKKDIGIRKMIFDITSKLSAMIKRLAVLRKMCKLVFTTCYPATTEDLQKHKGLDRNQFFEISNLLEKVYELMNRYITYANKLNGMHTCDLYIMLKKLSKDNNSAVCISKQDSECITLLKGYIESLDVIIKHQNYNFFCFSPTLFSSDHNSSVKNVFPEFFSLKLDNDDKTQLGNKNDYSQCAITYNKDSGKIDSDNKYKSKSETAKYSLPKTDKNDYKNESDSRYKPENEYLKNRFHHGDRSSSPKSIRSNSKRHRRSLSRSPSRHTSHSSRYRRTRSRSRSRDRREDRHRHHRDHYSSSYRREERSASSKRDLKETALSNLLEFHERECEMYRLHPNAHPDYNREYKYWSSLMFEKGFNIYSHELIREWNKYWEVRVETIFQNHWEQKKKECLTQLSSDSSTSRKSRERSHSKSIKMKKKRRRSSSSSSESKSKYRMRKANRKHRYSSSSSSSSSESFSSEHDNKSEIKETELDDVDKLQKRIDEFMKKTNAPHDSPSTSKEVSLQIKDNPINKPSKKQSSVSSTSELKDVIDILLKLKDKFGPLGLSLDELEKEVSQATLLGKNPFKCIDEDGTLLLTLIKDKLTKMVTEPGLAVIQKSIYCEAMERLSTVLNKLQKQEDPYCGLNIQVIASSSLGKNNNEIVQFIKNALSYHQVEDYDKEQLLKIFMAVKSAQVNMVVKDTPHPSTLKKDTVKERFLALPMPEKLRKFSNFHNLPFEEKNFLLSHLDELEKTDKDLACSLRLLASRSRNN